MKYLLFFSLSLFVVACGGSGNQTEEAQGEAMQSDASAQTMNVTIEEEWATDTLMRTPESVLYDEESDMIFVANIGTFNSDSKDGDGFISVLSPDGIIETLKWVEGLNDPKGMGVYQGNLYVADLNEVVEINIESGEITETYPIEGAVFLNDITINGQGQVYVSDTETDKIHVMENGAVSTFMEDSALQRPNGLLIEDNQLLLASAGGGYLAPIDLENMEMQEPWLENIPSADGIIKTEDGNYIVSTWQGEVHYVDAKNNQTQKLLDTKDQKINSADIGYIPAQDLLLVPTFNDHRIVAYKITVN